MKQPEDINFKILMELKQMNRTLNSMDKTLVSFYKKFDEVGF